MNRFLRLLFSTGLLLTERPQAEKLRERIADHLDDFTARTSRGYDDVRERLGRASRSLRGERSYTAQHAVSLLAGVGVGVGIGMLFAPARGKETRQVISGKVRDFGDDVSRRFSRTEPRAVSE